MPKVSIIVPVYNTQQYLAETLDSLLGQTLQDFEVIMINDGSTDDSQSIMDAYCEAHENFHGITQENAGVSVARNRAFATATGEYVLFLDSDDTITPTTLEAYVTALDKHEADVAIGRIQTFGDAAPAYNPYVDKLLAQGEEIDRFDPLLMWTFAVSNKCYRRETLLKGNVLFENLRYSEDAVYFCRLLFQLDLPCKLVTAKEACLRYRRRAPGEESVTQQATIPHVQEHLQALDMVYEMAEQAVAKAPDTVDKTAYLQNIIRKKEFYLMLSFYRLFWNTTDEALAYIGECHQALLSEMTAENIAESKSYNSDLPGFYYTKAELAAHPQISVILTGGEGAQVKACVDSVYRQSCPAFELFLPERLAGAVTQQWLTCENCHVLPDKGFASAAKKQAKAKKKLVLHAPAVIDSRMFRFLLRFPVPEPVKTMLFGMLYKAAAWKLKG